MSSSGPRPAYVYCVHVTRGKHVGAMEAVFAAEAEACELAQDWSTDHLVEHSEVTRFEVGQLGTRKAVAWFVRGERNGRSNGRLAPWESVHEPLHLQYRGH